MSPTVPTRPDPRAQGQQAYPPSKLKPPGPPKKALKMLLASKSGREGGEHP